MSKISTATVVWTPIIDGGSVKFGKGWKLISKKEQKHLKERRNEYLRIAEPIRRVAKRSYPCLLF
ncbi:hypothetical protein H5410_003568 [Solanum commersonii]|uniref:Uncharacterized protein n=1 Tax=Solanum commersonii TaxID=4109 RepID=A0A9J6B5G5_SOLCO|nr:hypothetical protein H5410_003568 [Solanum commersonii]